MAPDRGGLLLTLGLSAAPVPVEEGPTVDLPTECQGPSGLFALFTGHIERMILLDGAVVLLVDFFTGELQTWSVEKATGLLSPVIAAEAPVIAGVSAGTTITRGGVVTIGIGPHHGGDGYSHDYTSEGVVRVPVSGGSTGSCAGCALPVQGPSCRIDLEDGRVLHFTDHGECRAPDRAAGRPTSLC
jgi:hypothetical protein